MVMVLMTSLYSVHSYSPGVADTATRPLKPVLNLSFSKRTTQKLGGRGVTQNKDTFPILSVATCSHLTKYETLG